LLDLIIFSRNRAFQLYALLESIGERFDSKEIDVKVVYRYDHNHRPALQEVISVFPGCEFIDETESTSFKECILDTLDNDHGLLAFLTDDIIFKENVNVNEIDAILANNLQVLTFSLRLGLHIRYCYALDKEQPVPSGNIYAPNIFVWEWRTAQMDWGYPFSVDGHVFRKDQVRGWINNLDFHSPNSFEEAMQECRHSDVPPMVVCNVLSRLVNIPTNRVQSTHDNRCGDVGVDYLLSKWKDGMCLDLSKYDRILNKGVHDDLEIFFKERKRA